MKNHACNKEINVNANVYVGNDYDGDQIVHRYLGVTNIFQTSHQQKLTSKFVTNISSRTLIETWLESITQFYKSIGYTAYDTSLIL